jgi:SSS family solute:Na+ symporter
MKLIIIWITLFAAGCTACFELKDMAEFDKVFPAYPWFSLWGQGTGAGLGNLFSLVVGIICTQTYIQAVFSATNSRTAAIGSFVAALVVIPVGLPSVAIAMFMHASHPDLLPILVLPSYLVQYQPAWLGGIGIAGLMLSIVGSVAGLALGIGTMVSKDICNELLKVSASKALLWINRFTILVVTIIASWVALLNLKSQILTWNYLSMALRGAGVFLPLTLAIFAPGRLSPGWAVASMLFSTVASLISYAFWQLPIDPLFVGLAVSAGIIFIGLAVQHDRTSAELYSKG